MSFPKTLDDLVTIATSFLVTPENELEPPTRRRADGKFTIVATTDGGYGKGPVFHFVLGEPDDRENWTNNCQLQIKDSYDTKTFSFYRIAGLNKWVFGEDVVVKDLPDSRICPDLIKELIIKMFRYYYTYRHEQVPELFANPDENWVDVRSEDEKRREKDRLEAEEALRIADEADRLEREQERTRRKGRVAFGEAAAQARLKLEEEAKKKANLVSSKHSFLRYLEVADVPRGGNFRDHIHRINRSDMVNVQKFIHDHGRDVVASWWEEYKGQLPEIDF